MANSQSLGIGTAGPPKGSILQGIFRQGGER
jgi:hypothetical protein